MAPKRVGHAYEVSFSHFSILRARDCARLPNQPTISCSQVPDEKLKKGKMTTIAAYWTPPEETPVTNERKSNGERHRLAGT